MERSKIRETRTRPSVGWNEALDKFVVAAIPYAAITEMTREELIRVIEAGDLPVLGPRVSDHLPYLERKILERLAHLARRGCRNQGLLKDRIEPASGPAKAAFNDLASSDLGCSKARSQG